jgi:deferrochelatase/peroxidase EfeB
MVTIAAPLPPDRLADAEARVAALENPCRRELADRLDKLDADGLSGTHFASLHAFACPDGKRAALLFEFSADGTPEAALARILGAIGAELESVFSLAADWKAGQRIGDYLDRHRLKPGSGWFEDPGLLFSGTPGMAVGRIRDEARLASTLADLIQREDHGPALQRLDRIRAAIGADPALAPMLAPASADPPYQVPSPIAATGKLAGAFVARYLWPLAVPIVGWALYRGLADAWHHPWFWPKLGTFLGGALAGAWSAFWVVLVFVLVAALVLYLALRRAEATDSVDERAPDRHVNAAIFERENRGGANHMISITERKPGLLRAITLRAVFWVIGSAAGYLYPPGFLGSIGSIHFARWVTLPGSRDLVFLSNYDGSWQSYLEDFITRAHKGLTGVWSNTIGFPRSENLVGKGATDGERFKRYARRSMIPTRFWYSGYPAIGTSAIRTNAQIRRGLSGAMTEDEASAFLALFGSAPRPPDKLVSSEIQSLVFGGLGFMPAGLVMVLNLPDDVVRARAFLRVVRPHVAFNDGRRLKARAVVTLAIGATGLKRLGMPDDALESFSFAFLEGMIGEARARILGDSGDNAAEHWVWGAERPDLALLIYGVDHEAVAALRATVEAAAEAAGMAAPHLIPLKRVAWPHTEPFGFVDGVSQPVIRGTYKGFRNADPIHLVEAGEFILGYPDNRGDVPPGPRLAATADPDNLLPLVGAPKGFDCTVVDLPRDLGFNGTYLVIRQLEQHVAAFGAYCETEAARLEAQDRFPQPYVVTPEFVGAKLVGRWKDGSSLARHPYEPASRPRAGRADGPMARPKPNTAAESVPAARPIEQSIVPDNDFLPGTEDPEALRCPFGAHIRRANPRDSLGPGQADSIAISNRHRIIRVGRVYQEQEGEDPGLLFMCLTADIERQFEFLQQTWLTSTSFHGLACEKDPVLGDAEKGACGFTIPTRGGPVRLEPMPRFTTMRGGGYFFLPGKRLVDWLCVAP